MKYKNIKILLGILFIFILVYAICYFVKLDVSIDDIKIYITHFDTFAPIVYIIMFALVPLTFFPDSILAIAGGLIFGLTNGYIYTTIGALIGGSISFFISRYWGRSIINKITSKKLNKIEDMINDKGFILVLLLRLIPLFPFDIISYGSGLTSIKFKDFLLATFFGTIPGILVFTNIGAQSVNMKSESFYVSISALVLLFIISILLKNRFITKELKDDNN